MASNLRGPASAQEPAITSGPLSGLVVVDLTRVLAGPFATLILTELGARVVKVEIPHVGDDARHIGPFIDGESAYFASLNRGKESITLNLKSAADKQIFLDLLKKADILVENFRPGAMENLGLGYADLVRDHPRLIYAACSGFGATGPYKDRPAYDLIVQAMGGMMSITGYSEAQPTKAGASIGDIGAGLFLANGIMSAVIGRYVTGNGCKVDISMLDCQVAMLENALSRFGVTGKNPSPIGNRHPSIAPFQPLETADGSIVVAAGNDELFRQLCRVLELEDIADSAAFASNDLRVCNVEKLASILEEKTSKLNSDVLLSQLTNAGVPCGPINSVSDVISDPQIAHRNMLIATPVGQTQRFLMAGNPIKLSSTKDPATRPHAPALDENRQSILDFIYG